jgi:hypothetical protein
MKIKAIPTKYNGIQMRSRLEATWAAFFDLLEWRWEYEPCDFDGWIPDFVIYGRTQKTYVEVKPVYTFPEKIADKIDNSGCLNEVLIVGETIPVYNHCEDDEHPTLGWLRQDEVGEWREAVMGEWEQGVIGFCHSIQCYNDRITNKHDGSWGDSIEKRVIPLLWAAAKNLSQWKPPVSGGKCPACGSDNLKDKGSFDKCMNCGKRITASWSKL